jgi:NADPH:quinone reductase-like Zn-dependent oxidoreductase
VDGLRVVERPAERPARGECVVQIEAATINRSDIHRIEGFYGGVRLTRFGGYGAEKDPPPGESREGSVVYVPGMEAAGTIVDVGEGVDRGLLGKRVLIHSHSWCGSCEECLAGLDNACQSGKIFGSQTPGKGAWSQEAVVPARQLYVLPASLSPQDAAAIEVTYGPVWWGLKHLARLEARDLVVIQGGDSNLGVAAVHLASTLGAKTASIVRDAGSPRARQLLSIDDCRVYQRSDVTAERLVADFGHRPRVVLELLGAATFEQSMDIVASLGVVLVIGAHTGAEVPLRLDQLFRRSTGLQGVGRAPIRVMEEVLGLAASRAFTPLIAKAFPLAEVRDAVRYADRSPVLGKTILIPTM